ncbi:hypothetical protein [Actinacidiphila alni]|uniref:hypothetical protein n=1 Tax=Actinacidiphila alni TaxID=380248 RepID=UPI0034557C04
MKRGDSDYEAALQAVVEILKDRACSGCRPLTYGDLSALLLANHHAVPAHEGPMPFLLEDASVQESPDGDKPLISALVVLQDELRPSTGFYRLARRPPYAATRQGDNETIWINELEALRREYGTN